jgi:hypothetical protein
MHEEILNRLRCGQGISSEDLAREFLKFKNPDLTLAHRALAGILGKDRRCFFGKDGLWHASPIIQGKADSPANRDLRSVPWYAVHVLGTGESPNKKIFHVSVWTLFPTPAPCFNEWFENPQTLPYEEQLTLVSAADGHFGAKDINDHAEQLGMLCKQGVFLFLSGSQCSALHYLTASFGSIVSDDIILISQLFIAAEASIPRELSLSICYKTLFGHDPSPVSAHRSGEVLAQCAAELIDRCIGNGIATMDDLEAVERNAAAAFDFSSKNFSLGDIEHLPQRPGVYAFKNKADEYLYIGKATNMRRRIMGYFRDSDESPEKLNQLRSEAYSLITSLCGSELESLIYEYRLIRKHKPILNAKIDIKERKGEFRPINDCIVLLPHADETKGMSFWFRRNQKIVLKPFDPKINPSAELIDELDRFFFSKNLPVATTDFPEQEIAIRWIKCHNDDLVILPVARMQNAFEISKAIIVYWSEVPKRF